MAKRFRKLEDGEWSSPSSRRKDGTFLQKIKCCDCGLVHVVQYRISPAGRLRLRAWRMKK